MIMKSSIVLILYHAHIECHMCTAHVCSIFLKTFTYQIYCEATIHAGLIVNLHVMVDLLVKVHVMLDILWCYKSC